MPLGPLFQRRTIPQPRCSGQGPQESRRGRMPITKNPRDMGAFKTPTVRDAARRAPYLHDGSEKTLESLIDFYDRGGG